MLSYNEPLVLTVTILLFKLPEFQITFSINLEGYDDIIPPY